MPFDPKNPDRQVYIDPRVMRLLDSISPSYHYRTQERNKVNKILTEGSDPFEDEMKERLDKLKELSGGQFPWVNVSNLGISEKRRQERNPRRMTTFNRKKHESEMKQ